MEMQRCGSCALPDGLRQRACRSAAVSTHHQTDDQPGDALDTLIIAYNVEEKTFIATCNTSYSLKG